MTTVHLIARIILGLLLLVPSAACFSAMMEVEHFNVIHNWRMVIYAIVGIAYLIIATILIVGPFWWLRY